MARPLIAANGLLLGGFQGCRVAGSAAIGTYHFQHAYRACQRT
ncbi:MAG: hypothetical protein ACEPO0_05700 [Yoonia sp.]